MTERSEDMAVALEPVVGRRLSAMAARWKLRAAQMEGCGAKLSGQFLRECAEELEAELQARAAERTSWFASDDTVTPNAELTRGEAVPSS